MHLRLRNRTIKGHEERTRLVPKKGSRSPVRNSLAQAVATRSKPHLMGNVLLDVQCVDTITNSTLVLTSPAHQTEALNDMAKGTKPQAARSFL